MRNTKNLLFIILLTLVSLHLSAQENLGIKTPEPEVYEQESVCGRFSTIFANKSKEIGFAVRADNKNDLYFQFNNLEWFQSLFKNTKDGIAVEILTKDQFGCAVTELPDDIKGEVLKPVYKNHLLEKIVKVQEGFYQVLVGKLPSKFYNQEREFKMLFLNNGYLCRSQYTYNLQSFNYELLDMGLYLDSISYGQNTRNIASTDESTIAYKRLKFKIPFKKSETTFSANDIKPLYDSLRITDFNIKKIDIQAYSSIEGSKEKNEALQRKRAQSIIKALQTFQKPTITTNVTTSENWVEFLNDIKGSKYDSLKSLSKSEIKQVLQESDISELEEYLQHHRKAIVTLYLNKIDHYPEFSGDQLIEKFNISITDENLDLAKKIQNTLFERMKSKEVNPDLLYEMTIPKQIKYFDFFNSNSAFRYQLDEQNILTSLYEFEELAKLMPNNKKISYNFIALKLRLNRGLRSMPNKEELLQKIIDLEKLGINKNLVQRMLINYHIINSELLMAKGDYEEKDKSVDFILDTYNKLALRDSDYLTLSQFVTYYYDRQTAIELLSPIVNTIQVDKKLLFYYLNLTVIDEQFTKQPDYRIMMLNAINSDGEKFCKIFDAVEKGGVTFQLLKNEYLRATYCENCNN